MDYPPLTSYLVHYDDGDIRATDMAAGVTLKMARDYFLGTRFEITETTFRTCVAVEEIENVVV